MRRLDCTSIGAPDHPPPLDHGGHRIDAVVVDQVEEVGSVEQDEVRALAWLDGADLPAETQAAGGVQGGGGEALLDGQAELEDG